MCFPQNQHVDEKRVKSKPWQQSMLNFWRHISRVIIDYGSEIGIEFIFRLLHFKDRLLNRNEFVSVLWRCGIIRKFNEKQISLRRFSLTFSFENETFFHFNHFHIIGASIILHSPGIYLACVEEKIDKISITTDLIIILGSKSIFELKKALSYCFFFEVLTFNFQLIECLKKEEN